MAGLCPFFRSIRFGGGGWWRRRRRQDCILFFGVGCSFQKNGTYFETCFLWLGGEEGAGRSGKKESSRNM